jgi:hypothetical protein
MFAPGLNTVSELARPMAREDSSASTRRYIPFSLPRKCPADLFAVALPVGNVLGVESTVTQGVVEGYWLLLAPLPVGEHELRFGGQCRIRTWPRR